MTVIFERTFGARRWPVVSVVVVLAFGLAEPFVLAQSPAPITIGAAIDAAVHAVPAVTEATARAAAAAAAVDESKAAYIPRLDGVWQLNRASRNNVFGLLLPQSIVPAISGPVLGTDTFESVWGSAAGLLFSAEVFDFGRRSAALESARAQQRSSEASADVARLDAGVAVADAYLAALGAQQSVTAARANVERLETLRGRVKAQVDAELKPGADQSRIDAELAAARNRLITSEQLLAVGKLTIAEAMGRPDLDVTLDPAGLLTFDPAAGPAVQPVTSHPAVIAATASAKAAEMRSEATRLAFRPRIYFNSALASRASGASVDGTIDGSRGLWPDVPNWAAGLTVSFPFLERSANKARLSIDRADASALQARLLGVTQRQQFASREAQVMLDAAVRMAANIPTQLAAARQADTQARARYEAGLTSILEVADAQRLLAQAESEDALASLAVWRARLAVAAASGDLAPFIAETASAMTRVKP